MNDLTPEAAASARDQMYEDKSHPFNDRTHPDHAKAIDQYLALNQRALAPASARPPALSLDHFHSAPSGSGATPTTPDAIEAQIVSLERDHAELEQRLDALRHPKTRWPVDAELQASRILALTRQQLAVEEKLKTAMSEADRARAAASAPPPREIPWRVPGVDPEPKTTSEVLRGGVWLAPPPSGEAWDQGMLREFAQHSRAAGTADDIPMLSHVLVAAYHDRRYTEEESYEALAKRYGEAKAEQMIEDAQAHAKALMPIGSKAYQWAQTTGVHTHPKLIAEMALAWRGRRLRS